MAKSVWGASHPDDMRPLAIQYNAFIDRVGRKGTTTDSQEEVQHSGMNRFGPVDLDVLPQRSLYFGSDWDHPLFPTLAHHFEAGFL